MFQFHIITVSHPSVGPWEELQREYIKRLQLFARCQIQVVKQVKFNSVNERESVQKQEARAIQKILPAQTTIVACDEFGKEYTSKKFSLQLETWSIQQTQPIVFVIGGPLGLHKTFLEQAHAKLAFSQFTFPHDLAQILLLEQLYRACTIATGKTYHY